MLNYNELQHNLYLRDAQQTRLVRCVTTFPAQHEERVCILIHDLSVNLHARDAQTCLQVGGDVFVGRCCVGDAEGVDDELEAAGPNRPVASTAKGTNALPR